MTRMDLSQWRYFRLWIVRIGLLVWGLSLALVQPAPVWGACVNAGSNCITCTDEGCDPNGTRTCCAYAESSGTAANPGQSAAGAQTWCTSGDSCGGCSFCDVNQTGGRWIVGGSPGGGYICQPPCTGGLTDVPPSRTPTDDPPSPRLVYVTETAPTATVTAGTPRLGTCRALSGIGGSPRGFRVRATGPRPVRIASLVRARDAVAPRVDARSPNRGGLDQRQG